MQDAASSKSGTCRMEHRWSVSERGSTHAIGWDIWLRAGDPPADCGSAALTRSPPSAAPLWPLPVHLARASPGSAPAAALVVPYTFLGRKKTRQGALGEVGAASRHFLSRGACDDLGKDQNAMNLDCASELGLREVPEQQRRQSERPNRISSKL